MAKRTGPIVPPLSELKEAIENALYSLDITDEDFVGYELGVGLLADGTYVVVTSVEPTLDDLFDVHHARCAATLSLWDGDEVLLGMSKDKAAKAIHSLLKGFAAKWHKDNP